MIYRQFGSTGERVSLLGFGTAPIAISAYQDPDFDQIRSESESLAALHAAVRAGITFFDSAPAYGNKVSTGPWSTDRAAERMLGLVLSQYRRQTFFLATKNQFDRLDPVGIRDSLETSLRLLKTDYVDLLQVHGIVARPFRADNWQAFVTDEVMRAFELLKKEGKCRYIGISGYREGGLCAAIESGKFQAVMPQFNFFFRSPEIELVPMAQKRGIAIIPMRPLTGRLIIKLRQDLDPDGVLPTDPIKIAMQYICSFPGVASIPVGMRTIREVEHNVRVLEELYPESREVVGVQSGRTERKD